jgi:hypothetical protein
MTNKMVVTVDESKVVRELVDLVDRAYKEKPDPKDLRELQRKLEEVPDLWRVVFDMTVVIRNNLIDQAVSPKAARSAIKKNVEVLMEDLGHTTASTLEKLLIENIIITWLRLQWVEYQLVGFMGEGQVRMSVVEYWEKRLSLAQRRHLRACETLAKVRKLLSGKPAIQVNIAAQGGQQVNVSGDVVKNN